MQYIKLTDYCVNKSISYITGYRWFKAGQIPGAYQTDSGTILIPDDIETKSEQTNDAMSLFLKKTVEFSKNNATIEDFAAYIISSFQIKINNNSENKQNNFSPTVKLEDRCANIPIIASPENVITQNVDLNTTPQLINYTTSNNLTFGSPYLPASTLTANIFQPGSDYFVGNNAGYGDIVNQNFFTSSNSAPEENLQPKISEKVIINPRSKRGRKPKK